MSNKLEKILFIPDTHHPYVDMRAWKLLLRAGNVFKPHHIIILGDFSDQYCVSRFSKDPTRALLLDNEIELVNARLDEVDHLNPKGRKIFIAGNHEQRLIRYLQDKAPALANLLTIEKLLRLAKRGYEFVQYKTDTKLGQLYLTHDMNAVGRNSVHKNLDAYQHSIITGHTHRMAYVVEGDATGKVILSAMFGWLGDINQIDYMHNLKARKDWALGFGIGYLNPKNGIVYTVPVPIIKYTCMVNGEIIVEREEYKK